jgi:serine/threonine protein kinase
MRKEIQATEFLAQGRNPNLVEILGCGQFREPYSKDFYIDMELCRGSLEQFLNALDGPAHHQFCQHEIWRVMHQIASGVEYIHGRNTVHRDLKPPNGIPSVDDLLLVLFSIRDGVWKVADFGTAARGSFEQTGTVLGRGTTSYRAPEVSEGIFSVYSDVWGLGCILWKLLTKRDCFPDDPSLLTFVQGYRLYLQRVPVPWRPVRFPLSGNVRQNAVQYQSNIDATLNVEPRLRPTSSALKQLFQMILNS